MKATIANYNKLVQQHGVPKELAEIHNGFIADVKAKKWQAYRNSTDIADTTKNYFKQFDALLAAKAKTKSAATKATKKAKTIMFKHTKLVPEIHPSVRIIQRFIELANKEVKYERAEALLKTLQLEITEKAIRQSDKHHKHITDIQSLLIAICNKSENGKMVHIAVPPKELSELIAIAGGEKVYPSVYLLKRYIRLQGKAEKEQIVKLYADINNALDKEKVGKHDPLRHRLEAAKAKLHPLVTKSGATLTVSIGKQELRGLDSELNGLESHSSHHKHDSVLSSSDVMRVSHSTLGLKGKYYNLIGDPEKNFKMMIWGKPGHGKSTFALGFARHLATNHGNVIYYSPEEHGAITLQDKLERAGGAVHGLDFCGTLKNVRLKDYDFLMIDSKDAARMSIEDFGSLKQEYPKLSIIIVSQATKDGKFRGSSEWEHEVDTVVQVENGHAETGKNRYKSPAKMKIFEVKK